MSASARICITSENGGCGCGAVRYQLKGQPLFTHACHCTECQRRTGGAFGLTMMIERTQLLVSQGELKTVVVKTDSGNAKTSYFCPGCGVHVWNERDRDSAVCAFRPGTLDNSRGITVGAHVWTCSKQSWLKLDPSIPAFDKMYDRDEIWPPASLSRVRNKSPQEPE
jgi:hypothetical protein